MRFKDSKGHDCVEIPLPSGRLRLTYLKKGWSGSPAVRIQIRQPNGHLRLGPEVPVAQVPDFMKALRRGAAELLGR